MRLDPRIESDMAGYVEGQPLLDDEGMAAIRGLQAAHTGYELAERLNRSEIREIDDEIKALQARKAVLVGDREQSKGSEDRAKRTHMYGVKTALSRDGNKVYRHVLEAAISGGQSEFWYPANFEKADKSGRALAAFDAYLRGTILHSLPVLGVYGERSRTNPADTTLRFMKLSAGFTRRTGGLALAKREKQAPGVTRRYMEADHFARLELRGETHVTAAIIGGGRWLEIDGRKKVVHPDAVWLPKHIEDQKRQLIEINIDNDVHFDEGTTPVLYAPDGEVIATESVERRVKFVAVGEKAIAAAIQIVRERTQEASSAPETLEEVLGFIQRQLKIQTPTPSPV